MEVNIYHGQENMALTLSSSQTHRCSICLEPLKNPRFLPCSHSFCNKPCLQDLLNSVTGTTFYCPLCRKEFDVSVVDERANPTSSLYQTTSLTGHGEMPGVSTTRDYGSIEPSQRSQPSQMSNHVSVYNRQSGANLHGPTRGSSCCKTLFIYAWIIQYGLIGFVRFIAGLVCVESTAIGACQIIKGVTDIVMIMTSLKPGLCFGCSLALSTICTIASILLVFQSELTDHVSERTQTYIMMLRYYSPVDGFFVITSICFASWYNEFV